MSKKLVDGVAIALLAIALCAYFAMLMDFGKGAFVDGVQNGFVAIWSQLMYLIVCRVRDGR